jgi:hypothetical protein
MALKPLWTSLGAAACPGMLLSIKRSLVPTDEADYSPHDWLRADIGTAAGRQEREAQFLSPEPHSPEWLGADLGTAAQEREAQFLSPNLTRA